MTRTYSVVEQNESYAFSGFTADSQRQFNLFMPIDSIRDAWIRSAGGVPVVINVNLTTYDTSTKSDTDITTSTDWQHIVLRCGLAYIDLTLTVGDETVYRNPRRTEYRAADNTIPEVELARFLQFLKQYHRKYNLHPTCHILHSSGAGMDVAIARALHNDSALNAGLRITSEVYLQDPKPAAVFGDGGNINWTNFTGTVAGKKFATDAGARATTLADAAEGEVDFYTITDLVDAGYLNGQKNPPFISAYYTVSPEDESIGNWLTGRIEDSRDATETTLESALGGLQLKSALGDNFELLADDWSLFSTDAAQGKVDHIFTSGSQQAHQIQQILNRVIAKLDREPTWWQINDVDKDTFELLCPPYHSERNLIIQNLQATSGGVAAIMPHWTIANGIRFTSPIFAAVVAGGQDIPQVYNNWKNPLFVNSLHATNLAKMIVQEVF